MPPRRALVPDVQPAPVDYRPPAPARLAAHPSGGFAEHGAVGTVYFSGFLYGEEYLRDLQGLAGLAVYDRMWRSDGSIGAVKHAMMDPVLQAKWAIKPGGDDPEDVEIAQFVHDNLLGGGMAITWREHLWHALLMLRDGHAVFSKVWALDATGRVRLLKLAPRLARTLYRWFVNPDGTLDHLEQRVYVPGPKGGPGVYDFIELPGDELVVYTYQKEGANYQGVSVLRNAYKHWHLKDELYRVDVVACVRNALGMPVMSEPQNPQPDHRQAAADTVMNVHANMQGYVLEPFGWKFRLQGVEGQTKEVLPSIQHHDLMIAKSVLATFLNLDNTGSYARDWSESSLFLQNLHGIVAVLCEVLNRDVIRPLVDYNWDTDRYPELVCDQLDKRDVMDYLRGLAQLFSVGVLTRDLATENAVRRDVNLPELAVPDSNDDGTLDTVQTAGQGAAAAGKAPETADQPPTQAKGTTTTSL